MTFTSPISLFFAIVMAMAIFVATWIRRPALPRISLALAAAGIFCMALAAGGIAMLRGNDLRVAVLVDCSPSTRGASFRDKSWVESRVRELLGDRSFEMYAFADTPRRLREDDALDEISADHTTLPATDADAILLFSDGRFDSPPVTPPVYAVIDPALDHPEDATVENLQTRGNHFDAEIQNTGLERTLTWENGQRHSTTAPTGSTVLSATISAPTDAITARLSPGDRWPENDALSLRPSPAFDSQKWWVGNSAPSGWMQIAPENLPLESSAWLGPAIVVLNDVSADALSPRQLDRLEQYVRDLGGALVILGGDHAFAAGHYPGSALELLSPLASSPPAPVTHWVLLLDSSGSMAAPAVDGSGATRFKLAADALLSIVRELPKSDLVSIGSFARQLDWWSIAKSAADTSTAKLPPGDVEPNGPTNLEAAIEQVVSSLPPSPPIDLLIVSDAEADLSDTDKLAADLKSHGVRLGALIVAAAGADSPLRQLVSATGGQIVNQNDPQTWLTSMRQILRSQMPDQMIRQNTTIEFSDALASLPPRTIVPMNRTWLKQSATELGQTTLSTDKIPAAAMWSVGSGEVLAMPFSPAPMELDAIEHVIARPPRDPRFRVSWSDSSSLHVRIDAMDREHFLNDLSLSVNTSDSSTMPIPQTAPGRYEIDLPAPRSPMTATILNGAAVLDRFAVAGRYPREFDAVGYDVESLKSLADRSGGEIIEPSQRSPIDFHERREIRSLASIFAGLSALLIAAAVIVWRSGVVST